ncbi:hypothetical protein B0H19DRAFT_681430 [Mycena capillaripes]|nr:hypothetical protein B0H19DRAFT_681430 [Mycena capillaripes]
MYANPSNGNGNGVSGSYGSPVETKFGGMGLGGHAHGGLGGFGGMGMPGSVGSVPGTNGGMPGSLNGNGAQAQAQAQVGGVGGGESKAGGWLFSFLCFYVVFWGGHFGRWAFPCYWEMAPPRFVPPPSPLSSLCAHLSPPFLLRLSLPLLLPFSPPSPSLSSPSPSPSPLPPFFLSLFRSSSRSLTHTQQNPKPPSSRTKSGAAGASRTTPSSGGGATTSTRRLASWRR